MEAQFPAWVSRFLSQSRRDGAAGLVLQQEDLQVELQALERKILAKVLEDRGLSARDAQAGVGVALQQGGTTGVTEEVSAGLNPRVMMVTTGVGWGLYPLGCVQGVAGTHACQMAEPWGQPFQLGCRSWAHNPPGRSIPETPPSFLCFKPPLGCACALHRSGS